jgi:ABC-2 type transport system ATP-binding protein
MLEIINLNKSFGPNIVIQNLSLSINKGEIIYIHGRNGCGKSTLLKLICDIIKPDQGEIKIDNDVYIGALIENPGFIENETMKFNLKFLASFQKKYNEQKIMNLCQMFLLDYKSKSKMKAYSVGMRQKVGIIQAIMEDQNLIIFDEPTRGLDDESIVTFENLVNVLAKEGKSVIIASHDESNNIEFSHRYLMKNGKLIEEEFN